MYDAIETVRPGAPFNAIGKAIETHANKFGLGVVQDFIGHGVGTEFHSNLQIPHYYHPRLTRKMEQGMSFTIEPMLTLGAIDAVIWDDDWTAVTSDGPGEADLARHQWHGIEPAVRQEGLVVAEALHRLPCEAELVGVGTQAVHQRHGVATVDRTVQVHGIAAAIPDDGAVRTHHPVDGGAAGQLVDRGASTPAGRSDHNDARLVRSGDGGAGPVAHLAVGAEEGPVEVGCDHRREHLPRMGRVLPGPAIGCASAVDAVRTVCGVGSLRRPFRP